MDKQDVNVFLFYPNLLGYVRVVLGFLSFWAMHGDNPWGASFCYFLSAALDAFDGYLAREFNQSTRFGAMLDQLTDRCVFMALLMVLCQHYPSLVFCLQLVAIIDIASHWLHLHATDLTREESHKMSSNPILHFYYTSKPFLFFMCFGNEAFFGLLYVNACWTGPWSWILLPLLFLTFPIALVKTGISLVHLILASQRVANHDVERIQSRGRQVATTTTSPARVPKRD